jgi:hypothetical protein
MLCPLVSMQYTTYIVYLKLYVKVKQKEKIEKINALVENTNMIITPNT